MGHEDYEVIHLVAGEYDGMHAYLVEDENELLEIKLEGEWGEFSRKFVEKKFNELIERYAGSGDLDGFCMELRKSIEHFIK